MSLTVLEVVGKLVKRTITRGKKDIVVNMLVADDGREMIVRRDGEKATDNTLDSFLEIKVKAAGILEGGIFLLHEIAEEEPQ